VHGTGTVSGVSGVAPQAFSALADALSAAPDEVESRQQIVAARILDDPVAQAGLMNLRDLRRDLKASARAVLQRRIRERPERLVEIQRRKRHAQWREDKVKDSLPEPDIGQSQRLPLRPVRHPARNFPGETASRFLSKAERPQGLEVRIRSELERKLGRALSNIVYGFMEIPEQIVRKDAQYGRKGGFAYGSVDGTSRAMRRLGYGFYELFTFTCPTYRGTFKPPYERCGEDNRIQMNPSDGLSEFPPELGFESRYRYTRAYHGW
jgi:putative exosortase-associated protein (TIGR04073 family)